VRDLPETLMMSMVCLLPKAPKRWPNQRPIWGDSSSMKIVQDFTIRSKRIFSEYWYFFAFDVNYAGKYSTPKTKPLVGVDI